MRQTYFSPPTEQRYNTLDFACRKIVCQRRSSPFGYPLVPIVVCTHFEIFAKSHLQKFNRTHKNFAKTNPQNSIATFIFLGKSATTFTKNQKFYMPQKMKKSEKLSLIFGENFRTFIIMRVVWVYLLNSG